VLISRGLAATGVIAASTAAALALGGAPASAMTINLGAVVVNLGGVEVGTPGAQPLVNVNTGGPDFGVVGSLVDVNLGGPEIGGLG